MKKLGMILAAALIGSTAFTVSADAKHRGRHRHYARYYVAKPVYRISIDGFEVDRNGWRHIAAWDNTCHDLLYLHSQFACSAQGG